MKYFQLDRTAIMAVELSEKLMSNLSVKAEEGEEEVKYQEP